MVISLRKAILLFVLSVALVLALGMLIFRVVTVINISPYWMGGAIHDVSMPMNEYAEIPVTDFESGRFQPPSSEPALPNPYPFQDFEKGRGNQILNPNELNTPEDAILAYYGILREASNMPGYSGGCGTIGDSKLPYPYAYELLSNDITNKMTPKQFEASFLGIGHLTLLKLYPAYIPPETPPGIRYHMIEVEAITGALENESNGFISGSHFAYYYGIVTTRKEDNRWKIEAIDYFPEDFLCAPYHGWDYLATNLVMTIYRDWYHLIDTIDKVEKDGNNTSVYASGARKQYRFDFLRISNGEDVLLHEMVYKDGIWVETNLLKDQQQVYKLSILNPNLKRGKVAP